MAFKLEIVTPEARIFPVKDADGHIDSVEVDSVVLPSSEGEIGILTNHAPLVTLLKPGLLHYVKNGRTEEFAVGKGLVEVTGSYVRILTDMAMQESGIDEASVQAALEKAQSRLKESADLGPEESAAVAASIARSTAQLSLKRKRCSI